jgi:nicotinate phosphoribosyltransferase
MIINSLLQNDTYKYFMQNIVFSRYNNVTAEYKFKCRNQDIDLSFIYDDLNKELDHICSLSYTEDEIQYLRGLNFFKDSYLDFLQRFRLSRKEIVVTKEPFSITITGYMYSCMMFEIYVLAIVNELYFRKFGNSEEYEKEGISRLKLELAKLKDSPGILFTDFGTRRRYSNSYHEKVLNTCVECEKEFGYKFVGSSNTYYAYHFTNKLHKPLKPIGTAAHEYSTLFQAIVPLYLFQKEALKVWADEYRCKLGTALTDTVGIDPFLRDFDLLYANLFDSVRHDSGSPYDFGEKFIEHYKKLGIDPMTKTLVFSDGLNFDKMIDIFNYFKGRIKVSFGIGTFLTNSVGLTPLNIVIKMTRCNGQHVCKLSDSSGKIMCESEEFITYLKSVFQIKNTEV